MKPHCERCQEIIDQVQDVSEGLHSDNPVENLAGLIGLAMIVSPDYEPVGDGKWTKKNGSDQ